MRDEKNIFCSTQEGNFFLVFVSFQNTLGQVRIAGDKHFDFFVGKLFPVACSPSSPSFFTRHDARWQRAGAEEAAPDMAAGLKGKKWDLQQRVILCHLVLS